ncbi:hypothetical protein [Nonomuraea endophytica]|uniref:Peptidase n=1 Tax=Nonomuraea endophytica TaxID=714136 RepID=A0A7W8ADN0_9ACTN|nr:hypothetical protein [Nonomuraea endophytica]MBB5084165.1 hypothetical protein [Nonomuraea endophytica]
MRVHLLVPAVALLAVSSGFPMSGESAGVVTYTCTTTSTGQTQEIRVNVELTVPPTAKVDEQMTIGWRGSYVGGGELIAPVPRLKLYVYAGISKIDRLTSATGVATLPAIAAGVPLPLPESVVELKTTPKQPGSGSVHPASFNFGTSPSARAIECEVKDRGTGSDYPLTVEGTAPVDAETERPDDARTDEPVDEVKTPVGGADTGGGGEAGPDGRIVVLAGLVVLAGVGMGVRVGSRR